MKRKIFLSYAYTNTDHEIAQKISRMLEKTEYYVWSDVDTSLGIDLKNAINNEIISSNIVAALITEHSLKSEYVQVELGTSLMHSKKLVLIIIGDIILPSYLQQSSIIQYRVKKPQEIKSADLLNLFKQIESTIEKHKVEINSDYTQLINLLKKALKEGRLSLVCGAGVSASAGLPDWYTLLVKMFREALSLSSDANRSIEDLKGLLSSSNLIVAKYLRILLKERFDNSLYQCLYSNSYAESGLLKSIIDLSRPKRNLKSIESIITFNFDSLIEDLFDIHTVKYKVIYDEGINVSLDELPIYHVHGFLPRYNQNTEQSGGYGIINKYNLVFSEDGYHTQYIDPYSWTNLIQLNKYMNNTCLFIGISLTDPNLRRLLDISKRRSSDTSSRHIIIKKEPEMDADNYSIQKLLEEQDALLLGLNVIWVKDYDEIPKILNSLQTE